MSKSIVNPLKPRNPLVAAARFRQAGRHAAGTGSERREGRRALMRELDTLAPPHDRRSKPPGL